MRKFTLIFVLLVLVVSFVSIYLYFADIDSGKLSEPKPIDNQTSTENINPQPDAILAPSVYEDYSSAVYDKALKEKRVLVLYFTANWCPICREQEPVNRAVFDALDKEGVVGLRVHILDSETTDETDALAKKFDVVYQHTIVVLDSNGAVYYRYTGPLEEEVVRGKILEASVSGDLEVR